MTTVHRELLGLLSITDKIRPLIRSTREAFKKYYKPGKYQSINEGMVRFVKHLCKDIKWKGHHVFFDRFFTSIPLVQCLESYGIYACGTIKANRRGFPIELKNPNLERGNAKQVQHENMVITVWNDNTSVLVHYISNPLGDEPAIRHRRGGNLVVLHRPTPIQHYQQNYSQVDRS